MTQNKHQRQSRLEWVATSQMHVSPTAQREFRENHPVLSAEFNPEAMGFVVVNKRDDRYWIVDGQHRVEAFRRWVGSDDQQIQCEVYHDLSESEEAELFLTKDERKAIRPFDKFRIGVHAGRELESDVDRVVSSQGLRVSTDSNENSIAAVTALRTVYKSAGAVGLGKTLRVLRDGFEGDGGKFASELIRGVGLVCQRYNGQVPEDVLVEKLAGVRGGSPALVRKANIIKAKTGRPKADCIAAAVVETYNSGRGGKKIPGWFE